MVHNLWASPAQTFIDQLHATGAGLGPDQFPDREAHSVWWLIANRQSSSIPNYLDEATSEFFADIKPRDLLREVIAETLDVFHVMK